jgi:uncharacterized protein YxjI
MKKTLIALFFLSLNLVSQAFELPESFYLKESAGSVVMGRIAMSFGINDLSDNSIGKISKRILAIRTVFTLKDTEGKPIAIAKAKLVSWGLQVSVMDMDGNPIGFIKEKKVGKRLLTLGLRKFFIIENAQGEVIAQSTVNKDLLNQADHNIIDSDKQLVLSIKRKLIRLLGDKWVTTIHNNKSIDPRLLVFIPAFQSYIDKPYSPSSSPKVAQSSKGLLDKTEKFNLIHK